MKKLGTAACGLLALVLTAAAAAQEPIPVREFVKHPTYSAVKISPTGEYLAVTVDRGDQDVLTVMRTSDLQILKVNQLPDKKSVGAFHWAGPERLIFNAVRKQGGFAMPRPTGEWFAVNADGTQARPLIFYGTLDATQRGRQVGNEAFSLLDELPDDPRNVLMSVNYQRSSEGAGTEVVMMDTVSGRRRAITRAPTDNCSISLDAEKEPRFAVCSSSLGEEGEFEESTELYRRDSAGRWSLVSSSKSDDAHLRVINSTPDGRVFVLRSGDDKPNGIGTLDEETGAYRELFQDDVADVSRLVWSADEESLVAAVTEAGAPDVHMIDEQHPDAKLYVSLAEAFPGQMVDFSSYTRDGSKIVVDVYSDTNPGELYLYDRGTGQARYLMSRRDWLDSKRMATVKPFAFTARDGQVIHAYLTIPHGSDGRDLPMIVNPHGGPIGPRDSWGFNGEAQLLASRGYAVLQVNFRGSGGYGRKFRESGHGQWGQGIQNDINDATRWAIAQGHADPERICIYGGSFGGYSSLMAPIREPGLYQCAFGYVGVYSMDMMYKRGDIQESASGQRFMRHTLGNDPSTWAQNSPASRAAEVRIPVYLAAGARDVRTPPEQTELMNRELIAAGNKPEGMIIESGEMHGFYDVDNRERLYTEMLAFFKRHIGTGTVEDGTPARAD